MTATETSEASAQVTISLGLMSIGGAILALPVEAIREVVPGHDIYARVPASATGIRGAVSLRGAVIPIFDLRPSLGIEAAPPGPHVILIMRSRGRVIGLVADMICGMATVARRDLMTIEIETDDERPRLATHLFQYEQGIASLLDADRIMALPGLPTIAERTTKADDLSKCAPILLFSYGPWNFGVDAAFVAATVPRSAIERNALTGGFCLGVVDHHGYDMPVVDMAAAFGMRRAVPCNEASVVAVRFTETALLGFVIDEVHDIAQIPRDRILPIPSLGLTQTTFLEGVWTDASGRENLILDVERLRADARLSALASLRKPKLVLQQENAATNAPAATKQRVGSSVRFLTFRAGTEMATLITQVTEILEFPAQFAPLGDSGTGLIGFFTHKNRATPMIALGPLLGYAALVDDGRARILMAEHDAISIGFVVDCLCSIEAAQWKSPTVPVEDEGLERREDMVMIGLGPERRMLRCVDLARELRALTRSSALDVVALEAASISVANAMRGRMEERVA